MSSCTQVLKHNILCCHCRLRDECNRYLKPPYRCRTHGSFRTYNNYLRELKNWCLLWTSASIIPLTLFLHLFKVGQQVIIIIICVEPARSESYIPIFRTAENGQIVIQAKTSHYQFFFHKSHLWHVGHLLAIALLYILHQKSVLKPFCKSYLDIYVRKLNFKCILLSFNYRPPPMFMLL